MSNWKFEILILKTHRLKYILKKLNVNLTRIQYELTTISKTRYQIVSCYISENHDGLVEYKIKTIFWFFM